MIDQHSIEIYTLGISCRNDNAGRHFVVVCLEDFSADSVKAAKIYSRRDFYKVSLINGHTSYYYRRILIE